jgi:sugar lactone lactonase YvrE
MSELTIKPIGNYVSKWGEGPIWWKGLLFYIDIEGHKLIRYNPAKNEEQFWEIGERIGTVVPTGGSDVIYAGDTGILRYDLENGDKTNLADPEAELRGTNRFNDGKCDPAGRLWAGTISTIKDTGTANLYCLDVDGTLAHKVADVTNSNGICWSADATTMYYIDTPTQQVRAYDYDLESGHISNARVIIDTAELGYTSSPDGMTIDSEGMLWIAFCHGGCVTRFDPNNGTQLQKVDLPCIETTACAFGGENLDRLFVTTGVKPGLDEPNAGKVFVIDGLGIKGVPAFAYKG